MKAKLSILIPIVLLLCLPAFPHRLDDYLEATIFSVERNRIYISMRLVPGVAVFPVVLASIDTNGDGVISEIEQRAYAESVLGDLSLMIDGHNLKPQLVAINFPEIEQMKDGMGQIQIEFVADLPPGGSNRELIFENRHQRGIAAYLVNCLAPSDGNIRITAQNRNANQSFYQLDFAQDAELNTRPSNVSSLQLLGGFSGAFRLGLDHIAEGTDHLLFLLALLLPAPLLAQGPRWGQTASVRQSLGQIVRIVTAFTLGHSLTLALAVFGIVRLPNQPVEVLIAISILVSAVHAMRPLFPGREAIIAAFFGLIHGLAFAAALGDLGLHGDYLFVSILGFNLGIEFMQIVVVCATMPSLLILSRTRLYSVVRMSGVLFAMVASVGWITERMLETSNPIGPVVESVAKHGPSISLTLFLASILLWLWPQFMPQAAADSCFLKLFHQWLRVQRSMRLGDAVARETRR